MKKSLETEETIGENQILDLFWLIWRPEAFENESRTVLMALQFFLRFIKQTHKEHACMLGRFNN